MKSLFNCDKSQILKIDFTGKKFQKNSWISALWCSYNPLFSIFAIAILYSWFLSHIQHILGRHAQIWLLREAYSLLFSLLCPKHIGMLCPFGPSFMFTLGLKSISTFGNLQKIAICAICAILHVVHNLELMSGQKSDTISI